jgi:chloride channel protein, CIC family
MDIWTSALRSKAMFRRRFVAGCSVALVAFVSASFAHFFRRFVAAAVRLLGEDSNPVKAAELTNRALVVAVGVVGVWCASIVCRSVFGRFGSRVGFARAIDADTEVVPAVPGAAARAAAIVIAMGSFASVGREAAMLETGASLGAAAGRRLGVRPSALAATGIAAAFAGAYNAPIAAVFFVRQHLWASAGRVADRTVTAFACAGAIVGFGTARFIYGDSALFPQAMHPFAVRVWLTSVVCIAPVYGSARMFVALRARAGQFGLLSVGKRALAVRTGFVVLGAVVVALVPLTSGNGMDAIRRSATQATFAVAVALLVAKLVATMAPIAAGVTGGVFAPSLAVGAGAAMTTVLVLGKVGFGVDGLAWDAIAATMAVTVTITMRAPLVAVFVVAEVCGDWRLVPVSAVVTGLVLLAERLLPSLASKTEAHGPASTAVS